MTAEPVHPESSPLGEAVEVVFHGETYRGVIDAEYGDTPSEQRTVRVVPEGGGPYGGGKAFNVQLDEVEFIDEDIQLTNFCPICGSSATRVDDNSSGEFECPTHGRLSISFTKHD